jgi:endonuclease YncB( thermonuclease family)
MAEYYDRSRTAGYRRGVDMADQIIGIVTGIEDDDTIQVRITDVISQDPDQYDEVESIHIDTMDEGDTYIEPFVVRTKEELEARLLDRKVMCAVKRRDSYGHLLSSVATVD